MRHGQIGDAAFRSLTFAATLALAALFVALIVALVLGAAPAFRTFGLGFLIDQSWNPITAKIRRAGGGLRHIGSLPHCDVNRNSARNSASRFSSVSSVPPVA